MSKDEALFVSDAELIRRLGVGEKTARVAIEAAINKLLADGKRVERATDIPGLYYIDNGPDLTEMQVIHLAESPP